MCIRDSYKGVFLNQYYTGNYSYYSVKVDAVQNIRLYNTGIPGPTGRCLLYTSDAADERSSVDLGGRRIIKKKTN